MCCLFFPVELLVPDLLMASTFKSFGSLPKCYLGEGFTVHAVKEASLLKFCNQISLVFIT